MNDSEFQVEILNGVENLYTFGGLGESTCGLYVNEVVNTAKNIGINNVSVIETTLFYFEEEREIAKAKESIDSMNGVKTIVLHNDDLLAKSADINFATAFYYADISTLKAIESGEI